MPTSGPFLYTGYGETVEGGIPSYYYNFTANPNYYYAPPREQTPPTTPSTTVDGIPYALTVSITFGSMVVLVVFIGEFVRLQPKKNY